MRYLILQILFLGNFAGEIVCAFSTTVFRLFVVIKSYVKYKNAYGTPLKSNFRCEFKEVDGNRSLVDGGLE